jgi:hypothetical protein
MDMCEIPHNGQKAPPTIHGPFGLKFHFLEKANAIAGCLKEQFTHGLCDYNHERWVEVKV